MQANWQCPYPNVAFSLDGVSEKVSGETARTTKASARNSRRDRFDYWLIFAVSLMVIIWLGLIARCNPLFWLSRHDAGSTSLWTEATSGAHHYATMAFQG